MRSHEDLEAKISKKISILEVDLCGPAKISSSSQTPSKFPPPSKLKAWVDKIFGLESKYLIKFPPLPSAAMENHEDPRSPSSSAFTAPLIIRESSSAFSKPILPSSSSLLSPKPQFGFSTPDPSATRYRECLKNHAASLGGHVIDGCGEFMPAGPSDPLKCAACGCHRSFHRKEPEPDNPCNPKPPYRVPLLLAPPPNPIRFNGNTTITNASADQSSSEERVNYANNVGSYNHGSGGEGGRKKRFRTKFSGGQKEKMKAFAERVGWRVQKKDEGEMERFCNEVGITRQVLKVWMHNNKHLVKKQEGNFEGGEIKIVEGLTQRQNHEQEGSGA